ncbi:inner membrane protein [Legionella pneumophila]|nr:Superfamily II helicase and inactivated derivatives [Legionella pneumophila]STX84107.1 inner membrane protein [Legionella pneumophila]
MSQNHVIELANAPKQRPIFCDYAGGRFRLTAEGLTFIGIDKDGTPLPPRWICAPLYVVAKTRDAQSGEWGRLLEWQDDDGVTHQWAMPLALLQGDASDVRRELARLGLSISPNRAARDLLASYLQVYPVDARARCVDKLGWHGDVFVTASQCIGNATEKIVFQNTNAIEPAASVKGSFEEWRDSIGRLASGNSRLVFAISVALAPVLAKVVGEDSGGFHFRGASSSGKSTALSLAASVWGNPQSYCRLWRSTTNGLEGLAALHNDGLLILDELSQMDPREAGEAAYLLANGQGKTRASRTGTVRQSSRWSLFFLSAGEESLTALMAKSGQRINAGQEIRLADIEADAGCQMGIFETIHDQLSPASMALSLKKYSSRYHGAIGLAWLNQVVANRQTISRYITDTIKTFIDLVIQPYATGQIIRVARRFA